jgi:hypothetical protein
MSKICDTSVLLWFLSVLISHESSSLYFYNLWCLLHIIEGSVTGRPSGGASHRSVYAFFFLQWGVRLQAPVLRAAHETLI